MGLTKKKKLTIEGQKPSNESLPKAGTGRKRKRGHEEWEPPQTQAKVARKSCSVRERKPSLRKRESEE